ncbi:MAG TPA: ROK family protein [Burkholderiales bacterium]|nr:ROK family protein [Burkholderiales bacterium]
MLLAGMDVGGTNFRIGVFEGRDLIWEKRFEADFSSLCRTKPAEESESMIMSTMASALSEAFREHPGIRAIGIGFPGFIDPGTMRVASSPNLPGLAHVDLRTPLSSRFGIPVIVENDALAAAYGEQAFSPGENLIYVGLGTGVGGGLILQGKPYPGEHGVAMEIGHIIVEAGGRPCGCGNSGCLERYASASGITLSYREREGKTLSSKDVALLAEKGEASAIASFGLAGSMLGFALSHILKVVDVSSVVIGGGLSESWHLLGASFGKRLESDLIPVLRGKCEVRVSASGDKAGMLGAACLAGNQI